MSTTTPEPVKGRIKRYARVARRWVEVAGDGLSRGVDGGIRRVAKLREDPAALARIEADKAVELARIAAAAEEAAREERIRLAELEAQRIAAEQARKAEEARIAADAAIAAREAAERAAETARLQAIEDAKVAAKEAKLLRVFKRYLERRWTASADGLKDYWNGIAAERTRKREQRATRRAARTEKNNKNAEEKKLRRSERRERRRAMFARIGNGISSAAQDIWVRRETRKAAQRIRDEADAEQNAILAREERERAAKSERALRDARDARKLAQINGTAPPRTWFGGYFTRKPKATTADAAPPAGSGEDALLQLRQRLDAEIKKAVDSAKAAGKSGAVWDERLIADVAAQLVVADFRFTKAECSVRGYGGGIMFSKAIGYYYRNFAAPLGGLIAAIGTESAIVGGALTKFGLATAFGAIAAPVVGAAMGLSSLIIAHILDSRRYASTAVFLVGAASGLASFGFAFSDLALVRGGRQMFAQVASAIGQFADISHLKLPDMSADALQRMRDAASKLAENERLVRDTNARIAALRAELPTFETGSGRNTTIVLADGRRIFKGLDIRNQIGQLEATIPALAGQAAASQAVIDNVNNELKIARDAYWEKLQNHGGVIGGVFLGIYSTMALLAIPEMVKKLIRPDPRYTPDEQKEIALTQEARLKLKGFEGSNIAVRLQGAEYIKLVQGAYLDALGEFNPDARKAMAKFLEHQDTHQDALVHVTTMARGVIGKGPRRAARSIPEQRVNFRIEDNLRQRISAGIKRRVKNGYLRVKGRHSELVAAPEKAVRPAGGWERKVTAPPAPAAGGGASA